MDRAAHPPHHRLTKLLGRVRAALSFRGPKRSTTIGLGTALYVGITTFMALGAINSQNNLLFLAFGLAVAGILLSGVISGATMMKIAVTRVAPPIARAGEPTTVAYTITNRNRFLPAFGLRIQEHFRSPHAPTQRSLISRRGPVVGAPPRPTVIAAAVHVPARQSRRVEGTLSHDHRGLFRATSVSVSSSFPFGLVKKTIIFEDPKDFVVAPHALPIKRSLITPLARRTASASRTRTRLGSGEEFFGLREYREGDPTRLIAWKPSARTGQLVLRQTATPAPPRVIISVDTPPKDTPRQLTDRALALALSAAETALALGMHAGIRVPWAGIDIPPFEPHHAGHSLPPKALDALARAEPITTAARTSPANQSAIATAMIRVTLDPSITEDAPGSITLSANAPETWLAEGDLPAALTVPTP